jgi:hypothetical protein
MVAARFDVVTTPLTNPLARDVATNFWVFASWNGLPAVQLAVHGDQH